MTEYLFKAAMAGAILCLGIGSSSAATVSVQTEVGTQLITQNGIRADTSTRGNDLAGMLVTAGFDDGSSETVIWEALNPFALGGVTGSSFGLTYDGANFLLDTTVTLTSLVLNAALGNSIFDIAEINEGQAGNTPTTLRGFPLEITGGDPVDGVLQATYSDQVTLAGSPTGVDSFATLSLDFSGLTGGGLLGTLAFNTDLDTLALAGDLSPAMVPVPLPAGLPLFLGALIVLAGVSRSRSRA